jgi:hypothetical protein
MTDRAEIERLLQMTGRTLEGLPDSYSMQEVDNRFKRIVGDWRFGDFVLHSSDVIELLVGALRDALDKPMQKPLTLEETWEKSKEVCDNVVWLEFKEENKNYLDVIPALISNTAPWPFGEKGLPTIRYFRFLLWSKDIIEVNKEKYGQKHRCWASRPTDEERSAAAWES